MAVSKWFDYNGYMTNKLAQVQKADAAAGWDMPKLVKAFAEAGFVGPEGAEAHFNQFGQYEDVAPNAFFNATEYYRAKAAQYYGKTDPKTVTDLEAAFIQVAIKDAGMSAWSHYEQFGNTEKVNPSNSFDTEAYMNAKLTALNAVKDGKQYTLDEVYAAFKAAGVSALEHFMLYGGNGDGEVTMKYEGKIPAEFAVPENKKVNGGGGSEGQTFPLTEKLDNIIGTSGNDTIIGDADTTQAADQVDGGAGDDVFRFIGSNKSNANATVLPTLKNVESLELVRNNSTNLNVSSIEGLKSLLLDGHVYAKAATNTDTNVVTVAGQSVKLKGAVDTDTTAVILSLNETTGTAMDLTVENFKKSATAGQTLTANIAGAAVSTLDLTALGDNAFTLTNQTVASGAGNSLGTIKTLNVTGAGKIEVTSALTSLTKVDASHNTGGVKFVSTGAAALTFTGGSGNDTVDLAGTLTTADALDGGAGKNTLAVSDDFVTALAKVGTKVTNFTEFESAAAKAAAAGNVLDMAAFGAKGFTDFVISGAQDALDVAAGADDYTVNVENVTSNNSITFKASVANGTANTSNAGGGGVAFTGDGAGQILNLVLDGNGVAISGQVGLTGTAGGIGINVGSGISSMVIKSIGTGTTANEITGGAGGTPASVAGGVAIGGSVQNVTIEGTHDLKIVGGNGNNGLAGFAGAVTVNASAFTGKLEINGSSQKDTIVGGSGNDTISGLGGDDKLTGGLGADKFVVEDVTSTGTDWISDFVAGTDKIITTGSAASTTVALGLVNKGAFEKDATYGSLADVTATFASGQTNATVANWAYTFTFDGTAYVLVDNGTAGYLAGTDSLVEITGISGTLTAGDIINA